MLVLLLICLSSIDFLVKHQRAKGKSSLGPYNCHLTGGRYFLFFLLLDSKHAFHFLGKKYYLYMPTLFTLWISLKKKVWNAGNTMFPTYQMCRNVRDLSEWSLNRHLPILTNYTLLTGFVSFIIYILYQTINSRHLNFYFIFAYFIYW